MKSIAMGFLTTLFAIVGVTFLTLTCSCAPITAQQRLENQRLVQATVCATAQAACEEGVLPVTELRDFACAIVLAACEAGTLPDVSASSIETANGQMLHGALPGVFRCTPGEDCRLAIRSSEWWNEQFREEFGEDAPNVSLVGPNGWITISEDDLPPHRKGSEQDTDNSNVGLMRAPTLLGWTDYGYIRETGLIESAHITLQRGEYRPIDAYHEAGHSLFGLGNRRPSVSNRNVMSTPPHHGWGLTRADGFAILLNCILRE